MLNLKQAGATKRCSGCRKHKSVIEFGTREVKGETGLYALCSPCHARRSSAASKASRARYANGAAGKAKRALYEQSAAGKASKAKRALYEQSAAGKAKRALYEQSAAGKAVRGRYLESAAGKASKARYANGAAGKAARGRYLESDKGNAARKRRLTMFKARRAADPAYSKQKAVGSAASHLISGQMLTSPTFIERTEFVSEESFLAHMASEAEKLGFSIGDYGRRWELEHKIPQGAYDFNDPTEIQNCWSYANVHAMSKKENAEKMNKIIDSLVLEIAPCFWPLSWQGKMPTPVEKEAFYAKAREAWQKCEPDDDGESNDSDESSDSDSDDDDDVEYFNDEDGMSEEEESD